MIFKHKKLLFITIVLSLSAAGVFVNSYVQSRTPSYSETEGSVETEKDFVESLSEYDRKVLELANWQRPAGPLRVALQAGHYKASEAPDEFPNLKTNTGTSGGGKAEWQVNLEIAQKTKALVEKLHPEIVVEILPATIPPQYYADVFVAIHADGNVNSQVNGFKVAAPRRDLSGTAAEFAQLLSDEYGAQTKLNLDPNVTRNMRGYYAFNWRRYEHSLHPKTPAVILETGFLTNPGDRKIIVSNQNKSATGITNAILKFLNLD